MRRVDVSKRNPREDEMERAFCEEKDARDRTEEERKILANRRSSLGKMELLLEKIQASADLSTLGVAVSNSGYGVSITGIPIPDLLGPEAEGWLRERIEDLRSQVQAQTDVVASALREETAAVRKASVTQIGGAVEMTDRL
jgi:hypothetical protein